MSDRDKNAYKVRKHRCLSQYQIDKNRKQSLRAPGCTYV